MSELITVKSVETKSANNGNSYRRVELMGGRWANVWDSTIKLEPGHAYLAEMQSKAGNEPGVVFWRINSATPSQAANGPTPVAAPSKDRIIQAECAAHVAADLVRCLPFTTTDVPTLQVAWEMLANSTLTWLLANDGSTKPTEEAF